MKTSTHHTNASTGQEAVMLKIEGWGMENEARMREVSIKRQIERVGVNRRRREKKIFELHGCL